MAEPPVITRTMASTPSTLHTAAPITRRRGLRTRSSTESVSNVSRPASPVVSASSISSQVTGVETVGRRWAVEKAGPFARSTPVGELGFVSEATGAAFTLPVGVVSDPVRTDDAIYVMRVDKRVQSDSAKWSAQKGQQRLQVTNSLREQKVRLYVENLRRAAKIVDRRREINALQRRQTS